MPSSGPNRPRRANGYLSQHWLDRVSGIQQLDQALKFILHDPLRQHCWAAGTENNQLVILVDSGAWATQLIYQQ